MLAPIVLAIFVVSAPAIAQGDLTQQPTASTAQTAPEPWPPPGVFRLSDGVTLPHPIKETKPLYRTEAMNAGIEGTVVMEAVVEADGSVGEIRVVRSLDTKYGMDDEAVRTLKQWRFAPGKKDGAPVPVLVEVEMSFTQRLPGHRTLKDWHQ